MDISMDTLPSSLDVAIQQAAVATNAALAAGKTRLQIEWLFPELKPMPVAQQYLAQSLTLGDRVKVFFSNAGAAALARRDWGDTPYQIFGMEELWEPVQPEDDAFVLVAPTAVEVGRAEKMFNQVGDRPYILLNPQLQDVAVVGIGYAGRELRNRFLSRLESCYYLRPLEKGAVLRAYPSPWQVWWETSEDNYQVVAEEPERPSSEQLEQILAQLAPSTQPKTSGFFQKLQQFLKALNQ